MQHQLYHHYVCREVPEDYVSIACQDKLPTGSWDEWYAIGRQWPVIMIMRNSMYEGQYSDYWVNDWVYRMRSSNTHFYLHMVDREDYDLMDAFDIPHLNSNASQVIDAIGWEESKMSRDRNI